MALMWTLAPPKMHSPYTLQFRLTTNLKTGLQSTVDNDFSLFRAQNFIFLLEKKWTTSEESVTGALTCGGPMIMERNWAWP